MTFRQCAETQCMDRLTRARLAVFWKFRMPACEIIVPHIVVLEPEKTIKIMIAGVQSCDQIQIQTVQQGLQ
jgi:hypothetical protein